MREIAVFDATGNRIEPVLATMSSAQPAQTSAKCHDLVVDTGFCQTAEEPKPDRNPWLLFGYPPGLYIRKIQVFNRYDSSDYKARISDASISVSWDKNGNDILWSGKFGGIKKTYTWMLPLGMPLT